MFNLVIDLLTLWLNPVFIIHKSNYKKEWCNSLLFVAVSLKAADYILN